MEQAPILIDDKNRINYYVLNDSHKRDVYELADYYNQHEILAKILKTSKEERISQWEQIWPSLTEGQMSIVAYDQVTKKLVGVLMTADMKDLQQCYDSKDQSWNQASQHLIQKYLEQKISPEIMNQPRGNVLERETAFVLSEYAGKNIMNIMDKISYQISSQKGYKYIYG